MLELSLCSYNCYSILVQERDKILWVDKLSLISFLSLIVMWFNAWYSLIWLNEFTNFRKKKFQDYYFHWKFIEDQVKDIKIKLVMSDKLEMVAGDFSSHFILLQLLCLVPNINLASLLDTGKCHILALQFKVTCKIQIMEEVNFRTY